MDDATCGCGREGKYVTGLSTENPTYSCNKYKRCPSYADLEEMLANSKIENTELIQIATDLSTFRDGTLHYEEAIQRLVAITNPNHISNITKQAIELINNATADELIAVCKQFGHEPVIK